jgi:antitoxin component of RelBE/YafQ-DinJ toxin-antitoxin module
MATITIRIDDKIKDTLQAMAKQLWLSLNQLLALQLRQFIKEPKLNLDLKELDFFINEDLRFYHWEIVDDTDYRFYEWVWLEIEDQDEFLKVLDKLVEEDKKAEKKTKQKNKKSKKAEKVLA